MQRIWSILSFVTSQKVSKAVKKPSVSCEIFNRTRLDHKAELGTCSEIADSFTKLMPTTSHFCENLKPATMASSRIFSVFNRNQSRSEFLRDFRFRVFGLITWIPAAIFFNGNVGEVTWIYGLSMYPYLNTSYNEDLKKDLCWNNKWKPTRNLDRGMLISFQ